MSIRPQFVRAILNGQKRYEFRRSIFKQPIDVVLIYATVPVRRVVAEFKVASVVCDTPRALWRLANGAAGIDQQDFFDYFKGKDVGYAIEIGSIRRYKAPFCPVKQFGVRPPQSFAYVSS